MLRPDNIIILRTFYPYTFLFYALLMVSVDTNISTMYDASTSIIIIIWLRISGSWCVCVQPSRYQKFQYELIAQNRCCYDCVLLCNICTGLVINHVRSELSMMLSVILIWRIFGKSYMRNIYVDSYIKFHVFALHNICWLSWITEAWFDFRTCIKCVIHKMLYVKVAGS